MDLVHGFMFHLNKKLKLIITLALLSLMFKWLHHHHFGLLAFLFSSSNESNSIFIGARISISSWMSAWPLFHSNWLKHSPCFCLCNEFSCLWISNIIDGFCELCFNAFQSQIAWHLCMPLHQQTLWCSCLKPWRLGKTCSFFCA